VAIPIAPYKIIKVVRLELLTVIGASKEILTTLVEVANT